MDILKKIIVKFGGRNTLMIEKETIALIWVGGLGLTAILSALFLISDKTKDWSEWKIVKVSSLTAIIVLILVILIT